MEWLLGAGTATGLLGVIGLAIYMAKMAKDNRSDLQTLAKSERALGEAKRDIDGYIRSVTNLESVVAAKESELEREKAAATVAQEALGDVLKRLASTGNAAGVTADIRNTLGRLSEMSRVPKTEAAEDS